MATTETNNFAAPSGVAYDHDVLEIEMFEEDEEVIGIGVHVVTIPRLAGTAVAATIVGNAAVSMVAEEEHLILPVVAVEGPAV